MSVWSDGQKAINDLYKHDHGLGNKAYDAFSIYLARGVKEQALAFLAGMPAIIAAATDPAVRAAYTWDTRALQAYMAAPSHIWEIHRLSPPSGTLPDKIIGGGADAARKLTDVPGFLTALTDPHLWLRVAEVGIGVLLVAVGVAKLTNAVGIATKISGAVGKIPIPV